MAESPTPDDLLARRAQELEALRQQERDAFAGDQREMTGEASTVSQHPSDVADFTFQRELNQTTQSVLEHEAAQVEEAMRARERGTYGRCEECGQQIPADRLAARPAATLCVACQRKRDGSRA